MQKEHKTIRNAKILIGIVILLLSIIVLGILFFNQATVKIKQSEKEAINIAKKQGNLASVDHFYWFVREKTYFTVTGKNQQGTKVAVIVPKEGGKAVILELDKGLDETAIKQLVETNYQDFGITKANLGLYKGEPVWEVVTKNKEGNFVYYLLSFKDGAQKNIIC